jgi:hypothetical protein
LGRVLFSFGVVLVRVWAVFFFCPGRMWAVFLFTQGRGSVLLFDFVLIYVVFMLHYIGFFLWNFAGLRRG